MDEIDLTGDNAELGSETGDMSQSATGSSIFDTLDGLETLLKQRATALAPVSDDDVYSSLTEHQDEDAADTIATAVDSTFLLADAFAARAATPPLSEWIQQGDEAEAVDYAADRESLVLVWDDSNQGSEEPELSVSPDPDDPEVMQVRVGSDVVADVYGDSELQLSDIIMIPLSSAELVNLSPK